jgi:Fe-S cluster assembly protein SufD
MADVAQNSVLQWYVDRFKQYEDKLNGERNTSYHRMRKQAIQKFSDIGFPQRRDEEWRFTNIQPIINQQFLPALSQPVDARIQIDERFILQNAIRLVVVDGFYSEALSDVSNVPDGVIAGSFARALKSEVPQLLNHFGKYVPAEKNGFTALNTAFYQDGIFIYVPPALKVEAPIQVLLISTRRDNPMTFSPRNLFVMGENSSCMLIEFHISDSTDEYFSNVVNEIALGSGAQLEYSRATLEGDSGYHLNSTSVYQNSGSKFLSNDVVLRGAIVRNDFSVSLGAPQCECKLNGISVGADSQLIDHHTAVEHGAPQCTSVQVYKTILDGKAHGVFNGKILVRKLAQKTDAKQTNRTLLLSDDAVMNSKPQLEIFADDVKCTHGAAIGQLDEEQVFYLRSRGIDERTAKNILTFAFASESLDGIHHEQLRSIIEFELNSRLNQK